jgi:peptide/nickel transport system substrate-binding protein
MLGTLRNTNEKKQQKIHPVLAALAGQARNGSIDRRDFLRVAALLGCSLTAAASMAAIPLPANADAPAAPAIRHGGILRVAMAVQKLHDPATYAWAEMSNQTRHIVEYLTITGADNITRPLLAKSWDASDDLKTWTFHLRRNIHWHNGERLTAEHVAWNIHRWLDSTLGSANIALSTFAAMLVDSGEKDAAGKPKKSPTNNAVEILDQHTLRLNLTRPVLSVPEDFYAFPAAILHPSFKPPFWKNPIGTGPFTLKTLAVASKCILMRARDKDGKPHIYWGDPVYLDEIHYYHYDQDNQLAALATGEVDAIHAFNAEQLEFAKSIKGTILTAPTGRTLCCRMRIDKAPFDNKLLRTALTLATNADEIVRLVFPAGGVRGENHHVAPLHPDYFPLPKQNRDLARARSLMKQAGYVNGLELTISLGNTDGPWQQTLCEALRNQWQDIGVRLNINVLPASKYWDIWKQAPLGATAWTHRPLGTMALSLAYRNGSPWNETGYNDPAFERLLDEAEAIADPQKRKHKMQQVEKHLQDAAIIIQPVWRPEFTMTSHRVRGYEAHPSQFHQFNAVWLA